MRCVILLLLAGIGLAQAGENGKSQYAEGESREVAAQHYIPARFAAGLDAASESIPFPSHNRDFSLYLNCVAKIRTTGEVQWHFCLDYYGGADTKFREAVADFVESTEISPASIDGEPVAVEFYFRVFFGRKGEEYGAGVFPNWGDDADKYGLDYEAPQRYNEDPPAPKCGTVSGISRVLIDENGVPGDDVKLVMSYGVPEHHSTCETYFTRIVREGRYIPALHQGQPVAATYVEVRGDPSWFTLKTPETL